MKTDYLYFEEHRYISKSDDFKDRPTEIINVNFLTLKPETNSDGYWGFRHWNENKYYDLIVDQYWIDFNWFIINSDLHKPTSIKVKDALDIISS